MTRRFNVLVVTWGTTSDEAVYRTRASMIDSVMPLHGGKLRADGTWINESWKVDAAFSLELPQMARRLGQRYAPVIEDYTHEEWMAFLDNPRIWQKAIDGLLTLTDDRFDAPWDGALLAFEGAASTYQQQVTDFLSMLAGAVRDAGMLAILNFRGRTGDIGPDYDDAYTLDCRALGRVMDEIVYGIEGYWAPVPRSIGPYWWGADSLSYGIDECGLQVGSVVVNFGGQSRLMPTSGGSGTWYSYADALELIGDAPIQWVENHENGLIRENCAGLDDSSTVWLNDGRWVRERLPLLDRRGIEAVSFFRPAMADPAVWRTIADWKRPKPARRVDHYQGQGMSSRIGSKGGYLIGTMRG